MRDGFYTSTNQTKDTIVVLNEAKDDVAAKLEIAFTCRPNCSKEEEECQLLETFVADSRIIRIVYNEIIESVDKFKFGSAIPIAALKNDNPGREEVALELGFPDSSLVFQKDTHLQLENNNLLSKNLTICVPDSILEDMLFNCKDSMDSVFSRRIRKMTLARRGYDIGNENYKFRIEDFRSNDVMRLSMCQVLYGNVDRDIAIQTWLGIMKKYCHQVEDAYVGLTVKEIYSPLDSSMFCSLAKMIIACYGSQLDEKVAQLIRKVSKQVEKHLYTIVLDKIENWNVDLATSYLYTIHDPFRRIVRP